MAARGGEIYECQDGYREWIEEIENLIVFEDELKGVVDIKHDG